MQMFVNLFMNGLNNFGMPVPQTAYRDTGNKISEAPAICGINEWSFCLTDFQAHWGITCLSNMAKEFI